MNQQTYSLSPDVVMKQQRELSMILLQAYARKFTTGNLEIRNDSPNIVEAFNKRTDTKLYEVWREPYEGKIRYYLRAPVQHKIPGLKSHGLIELGRQPNDGTCFKDEKYDYLEVLFYTRNPEPRCNASTTRRRALERDPDPRLLWAKAGLETLMSYKQPQIDWKHVTAWNETQMAVFNNLHVRKPRGS
jgi:hypothetical protein